MEYTVTLPDDSHLLHCIVTHLPYKNCSVCNGKDQHINLNISCSVYKPRMYWLYRFECTTESECTSRSEIDKLHIKGCLIPMDVFATAIRNLNPRKILLTDVHLYNDFKPSASERKQMTFNNIEYFGIELSPYLFGEYIYTFPKMFFHTKMLSLKHLYVYSFEISQEVVDSLNDNMPILEKLEIHLWHDMNNVHRLRKTLETSIAWNALSSSPTKEIIISLSGFDPSWNFSHLDMRSFKKFKFQIRDSPSSFDYQKVIRVVDFSHNGLVDLGNFSFVGFKDVQLIH